MVTAAASSSPASAGELAGDEADDVGRAVSELQRLLLDTRGVEDFLQGMAALAARLLPAGLSCGVAIEAGGKSVTASCGDDIASQVDEVQYLLDEGPCPEALRHQRVVLADDTAGTTSWRGFAPQAAAYGIRSCLCLPLISGGTGHRRAQSVLSRAARVRACEIVAQVSGGPPQPPPSGQG